MMRIPNRLALRLVRFEWQVDLVFSSSQPPSFFDAVSHWVKQSSKESAPKQSSFTVFANRRRPEPSTPQVLGQSHWIKLATCGPLQYVSRSSEAARQVSKQAGVTLSAQSSLAIRIGQVEGQVDLVFSSSQPPSFFDAVSHWVKQSSKESAPKQSS